MPGYGTENIEVATQAVVDRLRLPASVAAIGLASDDDVTYGDQQKIPRTPFICVQSGPMERVLAGASNRTLNELTVFILVYVSKITSVQQNAKEADTLASVVMGLLHDNIWFNDVAPPDGVFIHSFVHRVEPGFTVRAGDLMRTARLTLVGSSKTGI